MRAVAVVLIVSLCLSASAVERAPLQDYENRRDRVAETVKDGVVVLFAVPEQELVEYYPEPNFFYLSGFREPNAILIIDAAKTSHDYFFLPPRDKEQERWTGEKLGPGPDAVAFLGIQSVLALNEFPETLRKLAKNRTVYTLKADFERIRAIVPDSPLQDISPVLAGLRQIKSAAEIGFLEKAVAITLKGQQAAARTIAPGVMEYEVEAALEYEFRRNGAERPGFPSIVGSGPYSTILHYNESIRRMESGDVVVVDIGAEFSGYSADVTRTYPVSGKFTARQREIYQIVLDAQKAAIARVKPGASFREIHQAAVDVIRAKGYDANFIHGTSHHIGLEVHDVGSTTRLLEPNMVITVEPGIYIPEEQLGVRIEDDVLVTPGGHRVLSDFPKEIKEIQDLIHTTRHRF